MAGKIFKRDWFHYIARGELPKQFEQLVQAWDTAYEEKKSADWSVCVTAGLAQGRVYILDVYRARMEFIELISQVKSQYVKHHPQIVLVEKAASGRSALQVLKRETTLPVIETDPGGNDKQAKARSITPYFESGRIVFVAEATWLETFEDELTLFPDAAHDDQVDALVYAVLRLMMHGSGIHV
jgi:predicted phage terminase large subunit-like protein